MYRQTTRIRNASALKTCRRLELLLLIILAFGGLLSSAVATAAPGDLDTSFGSSGIVTGAGLARYDVKLLVQPDGKIVTFSGSNPFALSRYGINGTLDNSFGIVGTATTLPTGAESFEGKAVALQSDGKIVAVGQINDPVSWRAFAMIRFLSDGSVDTSFGINGLVAISLYSNGTKFRAVAVQADGKIVASGISKSGSTEYFITYRFNPDGSQDTSFNPYSNLTSFSGTTSSGDRQGIALESDGKILMVGKKNNNVTYIDTIVIARINTDGSISQSNTSVQVGSHTSLYNVGAVAVTPIGQILVGGWVSIEGGMGRRYFLSRFSTDLQLDTTFGNGGHVIGAIGDCFECGIDDLAYGPDNKIVATGMYLHALFDERAYLLRFLTDGTPDPTFSKYVSDASLPDIQALALQPDGKVLLAGADGADLALLRLELETRDTSPGAFSFTSETDVTNSVLQTSNLIAVADLDSGTFVPVRVEGGEYAINGSTTYQTGVSLVQNGDQLNVRHMSPATGPTDTDTTLTIGGISAVTNPTVLLGATQAATYTTTTEIPPVPAPAITEPVDGTASNNNTPTITGTSVAGYTVTLRRNGSDLATLTADGSGNWSHTVSALADGDHIFTAIATDGGGNSSAESTAVTLTIDTVAPAAPVITSPADGAISNADSLSVSGTAQASSTVTIKGGETVFGSTSADGSGNWSRTIGGEGTLGEGSLSITAIATDDVSSGLVVSNNAPSVFPIGITTVTFSATDEAGNSDDATAQVTVADLSAPVVTPPSAVTLAAESANGTATTNASGFLSGGSALDTVDGAVSVVAMYMDAHLPLGATTVTFQAMDNAGNTGTATATVTVTDQAAPVVTPPADTTLAASSANGVDISAAAAFIADATATDNVDGTVTITNDAPAVLPLGVTTVTFTASDAASNSGAATATVTVTDQTGPVITTNSGLVLVGDAALGGLNASHLDIQVLLNDVSADDNVDGGVSVSDDAPGFFPIGRRTVTFSATDSAGNSSAESVVVIINDPEATGNDAPAASGTGLTVAQSIAAGLDPNATTTDTDGDGVDDNLEVGDPDNPSDQDGDGVLDVFESGNAATDASHVNGLAAETGTVDIESTGQNLSAVTSSAAGAGAPSGVAFPFGVISYETTVPSAGASQTVRLTFSEPLPDDLVLYKVDLGGNYIEIPATQWNQVDANSIDLTLTDGGPFDLDGVADGKIVDPLAPGGGSAATVSSGGGGSASPWILLLFLLAIVRRAGYVRT
ncbi:MAG: hypothetical protein DIZ78_14890 [endosymbiont of Escarpia spicata]|uniref:HYR domain-containing protein n=1 Tax=endosymbiont of Escarpia spicata TaxID=2200908 RepID=A0A370DFF5_9GAMM|nr:MAG: hypothetical protein DIZ78_14890 [endosymbiont of Escarpia spicata]